MLGHRIPFPNIGRTGVEVAAVATSRRCSMFVLIYVNGRTLQVLSLTASIMEFSKWRI
jgi:hypothetical protein